MSNKRILIVESDGIIALHFKNILTRLGYDVLGPVVTGEEAIREAEQTPPDLLLVDINPAGELNGIETAVQIRSRFDIPVVYMTAAYPSDDLVQEAKVTEPYSFLVKPVRDGELRGAIEVALSEHEMETKQKQGEQT